ncbi:hypothetical protein BD560DRAFT_406367 [Blakeslea trispora]|nr:hypothetical protein BD560DRAFT_406367 [Blakeslea trispora]
MESYSPTFFLPRRDYFSCRSSGLFNTMLMKTTVLLIEVVLFNSFVSFLTSHTSSSVVLFYLFFYFPFTHLYIFHVYLNHCRVLPSGSLIRLQDMCDG